MKTYHKYLSVILLLTTFSANAGLFLNHSLNYHSESDSDDTEPFSFSRINHNLYLGANLDSNHQMILGTNFSSWSKNQTKGDSDTEKEISLLEIGPRFHWYFTQNKTWFITLTYNIYSKGTGTVDGSDAEFDGSGVMSSLGYHLRVSKTFAMGASLNYHGTTITSSIVDDSKSDVTDTYASVYPMLEMALRY